MSYPNRTYSVKDTAGGISYNPSAVTAALTSEQTMTVTGVGAKEVVVVSLPNAGTGSALLHLTGWRVSAANTIKLEFVNLDANNAHTPTSPATSDPWGVTVVGVKP